MSCSVDKAVAAIRRGRPVIVVDAEDRDNDGDGLDVVERVALQCGVTADNLRYLRSKRDKLGHLLDLLDDLPDDVQVVPR